MRAIDTLHLEYPFAGSRMLQSVLLAEGHVTGRLHAPRYRSAWDRRALPPPDTSKRAPAHKIPRICFASWR
jgi:putative transposase